MIFKGRSIGMRFDPLFFEFLIEREIGKVMRDVL